MLRILTGVIIAAHALLKIVSLSDYISSVIEQFYDVILDETSLLIGAALLPFAEFFIGLLIICKVSIKKALGAALLISIIMSYFIVSKSLYPKLIYHCFVVALLLIVYATSENRQTPILSIKPERLN